MSKKQVLIAYSRKSYEWRSVGITHACLEHRYTPQEITDHLGTHCLADS